MRKYIWYILTILLLAIILILEAVGINSLRQTPQTEPKVLGGATTTEGQTTGTQTQSETGTAGTTTETPPTELDLTATQKYKVTGQLQIPGQATQNLDWVETWEIAKDELVAGFETRTFTVNVSSTRADDTPTVTNYAIYPDGKIVATNFYTVNPQEPLDCKTSLPLYLPPGTDTAPATMDCLVSNEFPLTFSGTAIAGPEYQYTLASTGKSFKVRDVRIVPGEFTTSEEAQGVTAAFRGISGPGIGTVEFDGSLGNAIFGQLGAGVASDAHGELTETTSTTIWSY